MSALEAVVYPLVAVKEILIVLSVSVPVDVMLRREYAPVNCDVILIAKYCRFKRDSLCVIIFHSPPLTSTVASGDVASVQ